MAKAKSKWIRVEVTEYGIGLDALEGDLDKIIERLQSMNDDLEKKGFRTIQLDREYGYNDEISFEVTAERLETKKEVTKRIDDARKKRAAVKKFNATREQSEYHHFLELKEKYEGG